MGNCNMGRRQGISQCLVGGHPAYNIEFAAGKSVPRREMWI